MVYHIKFSIINSKFRSTLFKGLQVWAEPIKSFLYIELFGANSLAVCVLRQCLKKQATAFKNVTIKIMHCHCNAMTVHIIISISFSCCYRKFWLPNGLLFGGLNIMARANATAAKKATLLKLLICRFLRAN